MDCPVGLPGAPGKKIQPYGVLPPGDIPSALIDVALFVLLALNDEREVTGLSDVDYLNLNEELAVDAFGCWLCLVLCEGTLQDLWKVRR